MRAVSCGHLHKSRRWIDLAGGAYGDKQIALGERGFDLFHRQRHFAKPHDMGTQQPRLAAAGAEGRCGYVVCPRENGFGFRATGFEQFSVHMNEIATAGALVQIIHVLRHQREIPREGPFKVCKRHVSWIGVGLCDQLSASSVIKLLYQ